MRRGGPAGEGRGVLEEWGGKNSEGWAFIRGSAACS